MEKLKLQRNRQEIMLSPEQYQEVTKQVNAAVTIKKDHERLRETDFVKEYESLKMTAEGWMKENRTLKQETSCKRKLVY